MQTAAMLAGMPLVAVGALRSAKARLCNEFHFHAGQEVDDALLAMTADADVLQRMTSTYHSVLGDNTSDASRCKTALRLAAKSLGGNVQARCGVQRTQATGPRSRALLSYAEAVLKAWQGEVAAEAHLIREMLLKHAEAYWPFLRPRASQPRQRGMLSTELCLPRLQALQSCDVQSKTPRKARLGGS